MTEEELGRILGHAIGELEGALENIEATVLHLASVDGKVIMSEEIDNKPTVEPQMTIHEFGEILGNSLGELDPPS